MKASALKLAAPILLAAIAIGWLQLWLGHNMFMVVPATVRTLLALIAGLITYADIRRERVARPGIGTHLRQTGLLYALLLVGWFIQGEGLTAPGGRQIVSATVTMIIANALTIGASRFVKADALKLATPVLLASFAEGWLRVWQGSDLPGTMPATLQALLAVITGLMTYVAVRLERAQRPGIMVHLRHGALLYLFLFITWADHGEGLTPTGGRLLMLVLAIMIIANAVTVGVYRLVTTVLARRRTA